MKILTRETNPFNDPKKRAELWERLRKNGTRVTSQELRDMKAARDKEKNNNPTQSSSPTSDT